MATKKFEEFTAINETGLYVVELKDAVNGRQVWNCTGASVFDGEGNVVLNAISGPVKVPVSSILKIY